MKKFYLMAAAALALPVAASAAAPAIVSWGGANGYSGGDWTIGDQFTANSNVSVSALGVYDPGGQAMSAETVSLWTDTGTLLATTVVDSSGTLQGDFRYTSLGSALTLTAGQSYRIGVGVGNAPWLYEATGISTDPSITYNWGAWSYGQNDFVGYSNAGEGNDYISGNMLLGAATPAVPEPAPLLMFALPLLGFAAARRRLR